jgi:hypothetical protein
MTLKLTFKSFEKDVERWMDKHGTPDVLPGGTHCIRGYDQAKEFVLKSYLENECYDELIACVLSGYRSDEFVEPLTEALLNKRDRRRLSRLWQGLIAGYKLRFWETYEFASNEKNQWRDSYISGRGKVSGQIQRQECIDVTVPKLKTDALEAMQRFQKILLALDGEEGVVERLREDIVLLEKNERRKSKNKPDTRKMDEDLFWELIEKSRTNSDNVSIQTAALAELLDGYSGPTIKGFQKLLREKLDLAYHWDIWALAYLAQDGCSDDSFEMFRCWLILQGKRVFEDALTDVHRILSKVPPGLGTQGDQLLSCARVAYENRTGGPLSEKVGRLKEPKGREWSEEEVSVLYPKIEKHYKNQ